MADRISYNNEAYRRKLVQAQYLLFERGMSIRQAAKELAISQPTLSSWVKKQGWQDDLKKANRNKTAKALKFDDSLSAYIAWVRIHHPEHH